MQLIIAFLAATGATGVLAAPGQYPPCYRDLDGRNCGVVVESSTIEPPKVEERGQYPPCYRDLDGRNCGVVVESPAVEEDGQ